MADRVKVGVVGLGSLSQRGTLPHTYQSDAREKIVPVAVCDPVPGRAAQGDRRGARLPGHHALRRVHPGEEAAIPSGEHARHVIEIIEKAYRSSREGRTLEVTSTL